MDTASLRWESWNGLKKSNGIAGVCMAGHQEDCGRGSQSSWLVRLVVAGDIDSKGRNEINKNWVQLRVGRTDSQDRNMVERNRVQVQAGVSTAQARWSWQRNWLKQWAGKSCQWRQEYGWRKLGSAVNWKGR